MKQYALIGHPLGHTMSPFIHQKLFELSGISASYRVLDIPPAALSEKMADLKGLDGFNVTIPHKTAIIPYLEEISEDARRFGAVNTVACGQAGLRGYNTDCVGFLGSVEEAGFALTGRVLLLGCGGVSRMMAHEVLSRGGRLTIAHRQEDTEMAAVLLQELQQRRPGLADTALLHQIAGEFDLLLNGTPVGMYPRPDAMPVTQEIVSRCKGVLDVIYNPTRTLLLATAEKLGIPRTGGMAMLVHQAAAAQEIWNGVSCTAGQLRQVIDGAAAEMEKMFA